MIKMTFKILFLFLLFADTQSLFAECESTLAFRAAAFLPNSHRFKKIYGDVGASYQLEGTFKLCPCLDAWANFDWFSKHGKSEGRHESTKIDISNISIGVKFPYQFWGQWIPCLEDKLISYWGIGPSFSKVWLKNKSFCGHRHCSKWVVGALIKGGVHYYICDSVFIDLFADYLYQHAQYDRHVDIGGYKIGAGIGYQF